MISAALTARAFGDVAQSGRDFVEPSSLESEARDAFTSFAAELILGPQAFDRWAVPVDVVRQLGWCSGEEARCEELCAQINQEGTRRGDERTLIELVRESQLSIAVAAHAVHRGEVVVKSVIPELFAILSTRS